MDTSIIFDNSTCVFEGGSNITGVAVLRLFEPTVLNEVTLSFDGQAETRWEVAKRHTHTNSDGTSCYHTTYVDYCGHVPIFSAVSRLWGDGNPTTLQKGEHTLPFSFRLPSTCLSSFVGVYGSIRYNCSLNGVGPRTSKPLTKSFKVVSNTPLSPTCYKPVALINSQQTGLPLFRRGKVEVKASLPKKGFAPGEKFNLILDIENSSTRDVTQIDVRIVQKSEYAAFENHRSFPVGSRFAGCFTDERKVSKTDSNRKRELVSIKKNSSGTASVSLTAPAIPTIVNCAVIKVQYVLEVVVVTMASFGGTVHLKIPIEVGVAPSLHQPSAEGRVIHSTLVATPTIVAPQPFVSPNHLPTAPLLDFSVPMTPRYDRSIPAPTAPILELSSPTAPPYDDTMGLPPSYEQTLLWSNTAIQEVQQNETAAQRNTTNGRFSTESIELSVLKM